MTTARDFELFKKTFRKYQVSFGLTGWRVYFKHEELEGCFANISFNGSDYVATVRLASNDKSGNVQEQAKHECLHLLIARLEVEATTRFSTDDAIREASEEAVHRLMEVIP